MKKVNFRINNLIITLFNNIWDDVEYSATTYYLFNSTSRYYHLSLSDKINLIIEQCYIKANKDITCNSIKERKEDDLNIYEIRISGEAYQYIKQQAEKNSASMAEVIRTIITDYIGGNEINMMRQGNYHKIKYYGYFMHEVSNRGTKKTLRHRLYNTIQKVVDGELIISDNDLCPLKNVVGEDRIKFTDDEWQFFEDVANELNTSVNHVINSALLITTR